MNWNRPSASAPPRPVPRRSRRLPEEHMNKHILTFLALTAALLVAGIARADTPIYKWVDDKGHVHYSTEPHSDKAQQLSIENTATPHAGTSVQGAPAAASTAT